VSYSLETYKADKLALDAAKVELNCLVLGEGTGRCSLYQGEYARIASYFSTASQLSQANYSEATRNVARMFKAISTANRITGFDCTEYSARLAEVGKKLKSMRVFRRKNKIKCFAPKIHAQPCYCARLEAVHAAEVIANAPVPVEVQEELQARVSGALILEREFANGN
jgi:hypothetical protein